MSFISFLNLKAKKIDWLDIALIKFSCIVFGVLLVMLIPGLLDINIYWIITIAIILAIRPIYRSYLR